MVKTVKCVKWEGRPGRRAVLTVVAVLTFLTVARSAPAQQAAPLEYPVKAACLYWFAQFVSWPPAAFPEQQTPIVIGVLGDDPFGPVLEQTLGGKTVNNRKIRIERYARVEDIRDCHILFISASEKAELPRILGKLRGRSILTVGESEGFLEQGGQVEFLMQDRNVNFNICLDETRRAGLQLDANLLRAARRVVCTEPQKRDG